MITLVDRPVGDGCYTGGIFGPMQECQHYDKSIAMKPYCTKYERILGWNISGRTLKCKECLQEGEK